MKNWPTKADHDELDDHLLRATDVAAILGVSARQVWSLSERGVLPQPLKLGGSTRWRASDVRNVIATTGAEGGAR